MKTGQIQRIKISKVILKSVKGLLKEVHLYVHASVKASGCQKCFDSVIVPEDSSVLTMVSVIIVEARYVSD